MSATKPFFIPQKEINLIDSMKIQKLMFMGNHQQNITMLDLELIV